MAVDPTIPEESPYAGIVFPMQVGADYADVGGVEKLPDPQVYTIDKIYGMIRADLENVGVSPERISFDWFVFFFREMLNDYSGKVGEFQLALQFINGGSLFKVPNLRDIITIDVNGHTVTRASEKVMMEFRAAETSLPSDQWLFSLNGNLLSLYPAIGSDDTISILASVFAEDFDEDSADTIIPQADGFTLYHGIRWKCRESHGRDYLEAKMAYLTKAAERKARVERQLYPYQLKPARIL